MTSYEKLLCNLITLAYKEWLLFNPTIPNSHVKPLSNLISLTSGKKLLFNLITLTSHEHEQLWCNFITLSSFKKLSFYLITFYLMSETFSEKSFDLIDVISSHKLPLENLYVMRTHLPKISYRGRIFCKETSYEKLLGNLTTLTSSEKA